MVVPGWLADKGNNTWWSHSGGIHPAMPGAAVSHVSALAAYLSSCSQSRHVICFIPVREICEEIPGAGIFLM